MMYRAPTPFERTLHEKNPELPMASLFRYVVLEYRDNAARDAALEGLRRNRAAFEYIEPDVPVRFSSAPNEVWFGGAAATGTQWGMHKLNFISAWSKAKGQAWLAALDNGIDTTHPDLVKNYRPHLSFNLHSRQYFDIVDELILPVAGGASGHGTHVASIMASSHNDGWTAGGCPLCSFVAIRKDFLDTSGLINNAVGVVRAVDIGVQVLNMSFESFPTFEYNCLGAQAASPICLSLTHAKNNGVSTVAAAGNHGNRSSLSNLAHENLWNVPAVHPDVLAVSGLQFDGTNVSFWTGGQDAGSLSGYTGSNFGTINNGRPQISFAAPAVNVVASVDHGQTWNPTCGDTANPTRQTLGGPVTSTNTDGVGYCTGTSMAAPHISAMAGLVKSANPLLDTEGVKSVLIQASECLQTGTDKPCTEASPLTNPSGQNITGDAMKKLGYGVPKADKAVQIALGGSSAKNRLTPLFGYYNVDGDNHFYTTNPQMAIAAKRNTLQPAPKFKFSPATINCALVPSPCLYPADHLVLQQSSTVYVRNPDGQAAKKDNPISVVFEYTKNGVANSTARAEIATLSSNGVIAGTEYNVLLRYGPDNYTITGIPKFAAGALTGTDITIKPISISTYPLTYQEIGLPIPGYPNLPCGSTYSINLSGVGTLSCDQSWPARAVAMFLTTHVDPDPPSPPSPARQLLKLYRFSCSPDDPCNITDALNPKKPYHVAFRYTTVETDLVANTNEGYKLDGIEGYVYAPVGEPPAGAQRLCARRNTARHDWVLYLTSTNTCYSQNNDPFLNNNPLLPGINGSGYDFIPELLGFSYPVSYLTADSDGDGLTDAVEMQEGRNPNAKDNDFLNTPNDHRLFVEQQYRDFLGREPELAGLLHWQQEINTGARTRASVIEYFLTSGEFGLHVPRIVRLYLGFFNRIPDHNGFVAQVGALKSGTALETIANSFATSPEFTQTYGANLSNSQYVTLVYQNVLGRSPSSNEVNAWVALMNQGWSRGRVMLGFTESQEFTNKSANRVFVISAYEGMLRREAEPAGYAFWVTYMNNGNSGVALINEFLSAPEYRERFLPL
jgi:Subtilase family/Domain of unknown function (DUF4214)/Bacterial TSP3 repeat